MIEERFTESAEARGTISEGEVAETEGIEAPPPPSPVAADRRRQSRRASARRREGRAIQQARAEKTRRELGLGPDEPLPMHVFEHRRVRDPGRHEARERREENRHRRHPG